MGHMWYVRRGKEKNNLFLKLSTIYEGKKGNPRDRGKTRWCSKGKGMN